MGATAATATTPSVRWALPRDSALPPTMKQRIHAEAHGSSPTARQLSAKTTETATASATATNSTRSTHEAPRPGTRPRCRPEHPESTSADVQAPGPVHTGGGLSMPGTAPEPPSGQHRGHARRTSGTVLSRKWAGARTGKDVTRTRSPWSARASPQESPWTAPVRTDRAALARVGEAAVLTGPPEDSLSG